MPRFDHEPLYRDGRHYDLQHQSLRHDIDFWIDCAHRFGEPILELACGTGRLTIPLAHAGFRITGIDVSHGMLSEARRKTENDARAPRFVDGDVRDFSLDARFRLIFFPFNSIAHLHAREDIERCLACVRRHLAPEGRFVIAFFNPRIDLLARPADAVREVSRYPDPDSGDEVVVSESNRYDAATQVNHVQWRYRIGDRDFTHPLNMRIFFPQELDALLHYNGFVLEAKYGDFDRKPFAAASPHQLLVARAAN